MKAARLRIAFTAALLWLVTPEAAWADNCGSLSDCFNTLRAALAAIVGVGLFAVLFSFGLDLFPGIGTFKGIIEAITGRDLVTGAELEWWERILGIIPFAGALIGAGIWAATASDAAEAAREAARAAETARGAGRAADAAREAERAARLDELAKDPAHGGKITPKTRQEAEVGLSLEESGKLPGPITRDPSGAAEFIDATGQAWDVKAFNSNFPPNKGGVSLERDLGKIEAELNSGENVILDTTNLSEEHARQLREAISARGWSNRILFSP